jgi:hypothetical protein
MKRQNRELNWTSPRTKGMLEQYGRARHFVQLARRCKKPETRFRYLIAAVYPARAIIELILESAANQELAAYKNKDIQHSRRDCEADIAPRLPHYHLVEKIRIHDFHRFGCLPPSPGSHSVFYGGPFKLTTKRGIAAIVIGPHGPQSILSGDSLIKEQRSLCSSDGRFFDDETQRYIDLDQLLTSYLDEVPRLLADLGSERSPGHEK